MIPELLTKPLREQTTDELAELGAAHGLRTADAVHLATAVMAGSDRYITNNASDFTKAIKEIDATYPFELRDPVEG